MRNENDTQTNYMVNDNKDDMSYNLDGEKDYYEWLHCVNGRKVISFYDDVKDIIGESYTEDEYLDEFILDSGYEFKSIPHGYFGQDFIITKNGVYYSCGNGVLAKDAIIQLIDLLTDQYNNYDTYHENYLKSTKESAIKKAYKIKEQRERKQIAIEEKKNGYVYIMYHQGYFKIGKSKDCKRLGEYTRLAEDPEYVAVEYVDDMDAVEKEIHSQFKEERNRNGSCEWFSLTDYDLDSIKKLFKIHSVKNHKPTRYYKRYVLKEDVDSIKQPGSPHKKGNKHDPNR